MDLARRASFLLPLSLLGCRKTRTPEAVSNEFIDRYYIERNHAKALEVAEGGAAERLKSERKLVEEAGPGGYGGVQPRFYYKKSRETPRGEETELEYAATVESGGMKLDKVIRLVVRRFGQDYKVTFFDERDVPPQQQQ